jgi:hypothetical protein
MRMILESIVGLSIIVSASLETRPSLEAEPPPALSVRQRDAALLPLVQRATECILQTIADDPRALDSPRAEEIDGLIVEAMFGCRRQLRAVVTAHDRMYGTGSGEAFVRGPFMDVLPAAVVQQARMRAGAR